MRKLWIGLLIIVAALSVLPEVAMAAGGKAAPLVVVAHTTKLTGLLAWWANMYNDNMFMFTILSGIFIPLAGAFLGLIGDFLMGLTGIDLTKRELVEH
ncbi:MAG: hypothetical protein C0415_01915 [Thermodesulfovibrio sp.]|nr:hypothetical protein [Thermodesulfovibrio sp.]